MSFLKSKDNKLSIFLTISLGMQHVIVMFSATVLVALISGLRVNTTLFCAGVGTLLFHLVTKGQVPIFLGSSFSFISGYIIAKSICPKNINWIPYVGIGLFLSGCIYLIFSMFIKIFKIKNIIKYFSPVVTGPIIISIGLNLVGTAIENCTQNVTLAVITIFIFIILNIYVKDIFRITSIIFSILGAYIIGIFMKVIDYSKIAKAPWFGTPIFAENTIFTLFKNCNKSIIISLIFTIVPIVIVTIIEHIGCIYTVGGVVNKDFVSKPGLHRTLAGNGVSAMVAAILGGPFNTTYGENVGVLEITKVYNPIVIRVAALITIIISFCPKFIELIESIPLGVIGGISLILYGMISVVGFKSIIENRVDFSKYKNVIILSLILVLSVGINYSKFHIIKFTLFNTNINLSGLAVGSIVGLLLNILIPDKDN